MLIVKLVSCLVIEELQNCKHGEKENFCRGIYLCISMVYTRSILDKDSSYMDC